MTVSASKKKLLLVTPPYHCGVVEVAGRWLPLHLLYVAEAARQAGVDVVVFDAMSRFEELPEIRAVLERERPDFVGISSITATVPAALSVARLAREVLPKAVVFAGGVHPSFLPEDFLRESLGGVDFVVSGEGESTTKELLETLLAGGDPGTVRGLAFLDPGSGELRRTPPRHFLSDLETFPAAHDLADWSLYKYFVIPGSTLGAIATSRGCSFGCTFCSQQKFWQKSWRGRSPEAVVSEIEAVHRRHGANVFLFSDEYPTQDADRWEEILDRIIALDLPLWFLMETRAADIVRDERWLAKYRKAGIVHVYVGLEATDQAALDRIGKDLTMEESRASLRLIRDHGMLSETSFVLGFPEETRESVRKTLELSKWLDPDMAHYLCITPWPYADLWEEMKDRVRVTDWSKFNLIEPIVEPYALTLDQIDAAIVDCYRDFYMGKMTAFADYPDEFRRHYMTSSMKLIMKSSFLVKKIGRLAVPEMMKRALA